MRKLAWACAALVLAITSLSAFIRLSRAGLGCEPWPQCYAQAAQTAGAPTATVPDGPAVHAARVAHRVVAVVVLLLVIAMVMTTLARGPMLWREGRMALGLLALALFLAILGRWTANSRLPAVMLGNLIAGFGMFALSWRLVESTGDRLPLTTARDRLAGWARVGAAFLVAQIILGGLVSAGHAGLSCPGLPACDLSAGSWQVLNPWRDTPAAADPVNPAGALVHGLHRAAALVAVAVLLPLGVAAWRSGRRAGAAVVLLLLLLEAVLGALLVLEGLPLPVALAHNMAAALLLAAVLGLAGDGGKPRQDQPAR